MVSNKVIKRWGKIPKMVQICRVLNSKKWMLISNTQKDDAYKAANIVLTNIFNEYMAYENAGVEYRFVRKDDLPKYKINVV